ncbi:MAG: hypothetical protein NPINA01_09720 [Nitrospinaceae bacterium]|nr:MAG: hypothetical protein NPINA01_09720 [Nitrospinaceae bacterium]
MNSFYTHNLSALKTRWPALASLSESLSDRVEVLATNAGEPTIRYGNLLLHSAYDPIKEGEKFATDIHPGSFVCLYGFGLGYHVQAVLKKIGPQGKLLVIELNPDLLSAAMCLRNQTDILSDPRFYLIFGREEAAVSREISGQMEAWCHGSEAPPEVLFHSSSFKCIPDRFPSLSNALEVMLMERRFPAVLGDLESRNYYFNREAIRQSPGIRSLTGIHCGQPGILISAGPSLDDVLPHLKRFTGSAVIACVDTALPILTRAGILPHYVFTLDPQVESFRHFREDLDSAFKLIYTPTAHAKIISCFQGEKFVVFKEGHSLYKNETAQMEEKGTTQAGGSVSCLGLDGLIRLGCDPVFLAGQDCAYSGRRTYSRESDQNQQLLDRMAHSNPLVDTHLEQAGLKKQIQIEGAAGSMVQTSQSMFSYKRTMEQIARQYPETQIYNLISHGAKMEHIPHLGSVNELMALSKCFIPSLK